MRPLDVGVQIDEGRERLSAAPEPAAVLRCAHLLERIRHATRLLALLLAVRDLAAEELADAIQEAANHEATADFSPPSNNS